MKQGLCLGLSLLLCGCSALSPAPAPANEPIPLLYAHLSGFWDGERYCLYSFSAEGDLYQVNSFDSQLAPLSAQQGDSWAALRETFPPGYSLWQPDKALLTSALGELSVTLEEIPQLCWLGEGSFAFSSPDKNSLILCSDLEDPATFRSYPVEGLVFLRPLDEGSLLLTTLDQQHQNRLWRWDLANEEPQLLAEGNYSCLPLGEGLLLKPQRFQGRQEKETLYLEKVGAPPQALPLPEDLLDLGLSQNGRYAIVQRPESLELYSTEDWRLLQTLPLPEGWDSDANVDLLTVSNDGARLLYCDGAQQSLRLLTLQP